MTEIHNPTITEISEPTITQEIKQDKLIKTDSQDIATKRQTDAKTVIGSTSAGLTLFSGAVALAIATELSHTDLNPIVYPTLITASAIATLPAVGSLIRIPYRDFLRPGERASRKTEILETGDMESKIRKLVYKGNGLNMPGVNLKQGDNFYFLQVPKLTLQPSDTQQNNEEIDESLKTITEAYTLILDDAKKYLNGKQYKALVVDLPYLYDTNNTAFNSLPRVTDEALFENKEYSQNFKSNTIILSKEQIESNPSKPKDIFEKVVNALDERIHNKLTGQRLIGELKNLKNLPWDQRATEAKRLGIKLDNLFNQEAESLYNGMPNVSIIDKQIPIKRRSDTHPQIRIINTLKGKILEQISYFDGNTRKLVNLDEPLEEILSTDSKNHTLLLSNTLSGMLKDPFILREITETKAPTADEISNKLKDLNISIGEIPNDYLVFKPKKRRKMQILKNTLSATILGATIATGGTAMVNELSNILPNQIIQNAENSRLNKSQVAPPTLQETSKPRFPENITGHYPDWVVSFVNYDPKGYYVLDTSSQFKDGAWINTGLKDANLLNNSDLYNNVSELSNNQDSQYLYLKKLIALNPLGETNLKLPIKIGTNLEGLLIKDKNTDIDKSSYKVYQLKDGTYQLKITSGIIGPSTLEITEYLVPSTNSIHATQRIQAINSGNLSQEAIKLLQQSNNSLTDLQEEISNRQYSINPEGKEVLDKIDNSPESFINAAATLKASDCDISNSEFSLLSSVIASKDFVNTAVGFMQQGQASYLDLHQLHRFSITNDGVVLDATPIGKPTNDKMTQEYVNSNPIMFDMDKVNKYTVDTANMQKELLGFLGLIGTSGALIVGSKTYGPIRRNLNKEKFEETKNKIRARALVMTMSLPDLEKAFNFFNWISWGGENEYRINNAVYGPTDKRNFLENMKWGSVQEEKIALYLQNPEYFEQRANIQNPIRIRQLAKYITS